MRVLFTSLRTTSHFLPLIPFIEACLRRGHAVAVAAPPDLAERVAGTRATFMPFAHPGDHGLEPLWKRMRDAPKPEAKQISIGELFAGVLAGTALPGLLEVMDRWQPTIVVRESQEYAAVVAAERGRVPHVRVAITAPSGETELIPLAAPSVDAHGCAAGLSPDPAGNRMLSEPIFTLFPAALDVAQAGLGPIYRFRTPPKPSSPLPEWWAEQQGPFVYVTLGTVMGNMEQMRSAYGPALDAVRELPIRVLLTIGPDLSMDALGDIPANVHVERFVPQDLVLPHAAAVLCHGGSGTVVGTLAAGVPMVVAPMFADQNNNAERIAMLGAGLAMPPREASAEDLRRALLRVLDEASFRDAARRVAAEIAALPLVDEAATKLEELVR